MEKKFPFPTLRVAFRQVVPDPDVPYLEKDGSSGNEVVKTLPSSAFYQCFPLAKDRITLQEYLDAGIPIQQLPVRLYESSDETDYPFTQQDIYNRVEQFVNENNKEEK